MTVEYILHGLGLSPYLRHTSSQIFSGKHNNRFSSPITAICTCSLDTFSAVILHKRGIL